MLHKLRGKTWREPAEHEVDKFKRPKWAEMRIETVFVKNPREKQFEDALKVTESQWQYIEEVMRKTIEVTKQVKYF